VPLISDVGIPKYNPSDPGYASTEVDCLSPGYNVSTVFDRVEIWFGTSYVEELLQAEIRKTKKNK